MQSFFASAQRLDPDQVIKQVQEIKENIFLNKMLNSLKSLIAVINLQRQIIAVNEELVKSLGFKSMEEVFGLRPGEAIHCVYANESEGGCGTSKMCRSCGAVKAIVNSIEYNSTQVELCAMRINKGNKIIDIAFEVTACPITIEKDKFITLHMRDITNEHLKDAMEKTFFHDINNLLSALVGTSEMLTMQQTRDINLESRINSLSIRVAKEVEIQRALTYTHNGGKYRPDITEETFENIIEQIKDYAETDKLIISSELNNYLTIKTDTTLLLRILTNMIKNGVEASNSSEYVKLKISSNNSHVLFSVWNSQSIPEDIHRRIFQEHFSTKNGNYRGLGTHSMKTFGEDILKGKVWFNSNPREGTTFFLKLPIM